MTDDEKHYVIEPAFIVKSGERFTYSSEHSVMTKQQLKEHLGTLGIIDKSLDEFVGRSIEEIVTNRKN